MGHDAAADGQRLGDPRQMGDGADATACSAEQVIRPTGLIDPPVEIKPVEDQVDDLINERARSRHKAIARW
jgi:excinuclease UvrABC helicase subunit UvrB